VSFRVRFLRTAACLHHPGEWLSDFDSHIAVRWAEVLGLPQKCLRRGGALPAMSATRPCQLMAAYVS
jgi:hypothetical protein